MLDYVLVKEKGFYIMDICPRERILLMQVNTCLLQK